MRIVIFIGLFCGTLLVHSQEQDSNNNLKDSVKREVYNKWSIRITSTYRIHGIVLRNTQNGQRVKYSPVNPFGLGVGVTYKYLVADLSFDIRTDLKENVRRFNLVTSYYQDRSIFELVFHRYNGFEAKNGYRNQIREDIRTTVFGFNYMHILFGNKLKFGNISQGSTVVTKSTSNFSAGGYFTYHDMKGDSSLVPSELEGYYNDFARIDKVKFTSFGLLAGYVRVFAMPKDFFALAGVVPGIGLNFGYVEAEERYDPGVISYKMNFRVAIGYSSAKNYVILSSSLDNTLIDIHHSNRYRYSVGRIKLVFGIRLNQRIKPIENLIPDL